MASAFSTVFVHRLQVETWRRTLDGRVKNGTPTSSGYAFFFGAAACCTRPTACVHTFTPAAQSNITAPPTGTGLGGNSTSTRLLRVVLVLVLLVLVLRRSRCHGRGRSRLGRRGRLLGRARDGLGLHPLGALVVTGEERDDVV